jgi:TRAP-type C4-dicarboxylate transport system substrate-binding protein
MTNILRRRLCLSLPSALTLTSLPLTALAAGPHLRFATLAPRGSLYHRVLLEMGEAWRKSEPGQAAFTVYSDGVQGDESDVVRRMRIGQLNGAMISVGGLSAIEPGAAALQFMPLMFRSWEEVDVASRRLRPLLEQRIAERGFVVLYWGEAGWIRFFSKKPATRPNDFKELKIYSWGGSPEQVQLMRSLGYHPVVLELADVLPALQTGLIDTVPVISSWALAAQLDTLTPHMLDIHWAPIVGAALMTRAAWDGLSKEGQATLRQAAARAADTLRAQREIADNACIEAMRKRGLQVHAVPPAVQAEWEQLAAKGYPVIRGSLVPADMFDAVQQALAQFRGHSPT